MNESKPGGGSNEQPQDDEKRRLLPIWSIVAAWGALSGLPLGIMLLAGVLSTRRSMPLLELLPALAIVMGLFAACWLIAASRIGQNISRSRRGWACARCGYDMRGIEVAVCPECGQEEARTAKVRLRLVYDGRLFAVFALSALGVAALLVCGLLSVG